MLVKPEEVGLSAARLGRVNDHLRRYIDAGKLAGTLTLVARRGKIAYVESQGHLEIERKRPVTPDAIFRIYSMTKPIVSVGLMMLWEHGRLQLDDPVHKLIPSWRGQRVFVGGNLPRRPVARWLYDARYGRGARGTAARILSRYALELFRVDRRGRARDRAHLGTAARCLPPRARPAAPRHGGHIVRHHRGAEQTLRRELSAADGRW